MSTADAHLWLFELKDNRLLQNGRIVGAKPGSRLA